MRLDNCAIDHLRISQLGVPITRMGQAEILNYVSGKGLSEWPLQGKNFERSIGIGIGFITSLYQTRVR